MGGGAEQPPEQIDEFVVRCPPSQQCSKPWIIVKNPWDKDHPEGDLESARMVLQQPLRDAITELNTIILDGSLNRVRSLPFPQSLLTYGCLK